MTVAVWFCMNLGILLTAVGWLLLIATFLPNYLSSLLVGLGKFFEIRFFHPVKLSDSRLSFGVFFEIRKIPQTSLLYTYFYWGEKVKQKEFPQHTFFTSYTDTRNTPHNIAAWRCRMDAAAPYAYMFRSTRSHQLQPQWSYLWWICSQMALYRWVQLYRLRTRYWKYCYPRYFRLRFPHFLSALLWQMSQAPEVRYPVLQS